MKRVLLTFCAIPLVIGCTADPVSNDTETATSATVVATESSAPSTPTTEPTSTTEPTEPTLPTISAAAAADLIFRLRQIDPGLVVNEDRALRRARETCWDIAQGKDDATVVANAEYRFNGGNATVDNRTATRIVGAIHASAACDAAAWAAYADAIGNSTVKR